MSWKSVVSQSHIDQWVKGQSVKNLATSPSGVVSSYKINESKVNQSKANDQWVIHHRAVNYRWVKGHRAVTGQRSLNQRSAVPWWGGAPYIPRNQINRSMSQRLLVKDHLTKGQLSLGEVVPLTSPGTKIGTTRSSMLGITNTLWGAKVKLIHCDRYKKHSDLLVQIY